MKRLIAALAILAVIFAAAVALIATNATNRPEGPAERWMAAISRDTDPAAIAKFGDIAAAVGILGFTIDGGGTTNREHLDRFEVGPAEVSGDTATVPVQVWVDGSADSTRYSLSMQREAGSWKVVAASPSHDGGVVFPSEGGSTYGITTPTLVIITLMVGVVVFTSALALVHISGARPLHRR